MTDIPSSGWRTGRPAGPLSGLGLFIIAATVLIDQATKIWADATLAYGEPVPLMPILTLFRVNNTGIAFSMFSDSSGWVMTLLPIVVSVIVIVYNIRREAPRTLLSLSPAHQRGISADDYEVIVVENGGASPLDPAEVTKHGANFQYHYLKDASPSPAHALNVGMRQAKGDIIGIMIDGARICTPGLLHYALAATRTSSERRADSPGASVPRFQRGLVVEPLACGGSALASVR